MASLNFNAASVPPSDTIEAVPAAWYNSAIDQSELKPTKDGQGAYLELRFSILDGQFVNRKVFKRLNIRNASQQAQEIAYRDLSAICHAVNLMQVADSAQLHGLPMKIKVTVKPAAGEYEASNDIKAFKNINESVGGVGAAPQAHPAGFITPQAPQGFAPQAPAGFAPAPAAQTAPAPAAWAGGAPAAPPAHNVAPAAAPAPTWQTPNAQQPWAQAPAAPAAPAPAPGQVPPGYAPAPAANGYVAPGAPAAPVQEQHPAQTATPPWMKQVVPGANGVPF